MSATKLAIAFLAIAAATTATAADVVEQTPTLHQAAGGAAQLNVITENVGKINCKKETQQVGACSVEFDVCGDLHHLKWKYHASACASGVCGNSGDFDSGKSAAEDAAKALFAIPPSCAIPAAVGAEEKAEEVETPMVGKINCKKETQQVGACSVEFDVCGDLHHLKWRYHASACASGVCGHSGDTKSGKGAAEDAAKALFAIPPSCAIPAAVGATPMK